MNTLSAKSYTRLTLALDIIRKLTDGMLAGYHELGIIKHQIDLFDVIAVEPASAMSIECNRDNIPCDKTNICWQAAALLQKECSISDNVHISIQKNIPVMGGLAGGSTNAATVLMLLNELWQLNLSRVRLAAMSRALGMDVPFYFFGNTAFDSESTGVFRPIATDVCFDFVLVVPPFGVSTKSAYQNINYSLTAQKTADTLCLESALKTNDQQSAIESIHNDFELSVFKEYPALVAIKDAMERAGCVRAFLSGSGSTMVGIANGKAHAASIAAILDSRYTVIPASTFSVFY